MGYPSMIFSTRIIADTTHTSSSVASPLSPSYLLFYNQETYQLEIIKVQTSIANDPSWIIVRKYERSDDYCIYTISDQPNLLKYLKEKEDS